MVFSISLGSRVKGYYGHYLEKDPSAKRRQRRTIYGTVIKSVPGALWRVHWECYDRTSDHKILKQGGGMSCLSSTELEALNNDENEKHLGGVDGLRQHSDITYSISGLNKNNNLNSTPSRPRPESPNELLGHSANALRIIAEGAAAVTASRPELPNELLGHNANALRIIAEGSAAVTASRPESPNELLGHNANALRIIAEGAVATNTEEDKTLDVDGHNSPEEDHINHEWIREELLNNSGDKHQQAWAAYQMKKNELIQSKTTCNVGKAAEMVQWKVRDDVRKPVSTKSPYNEKIGVKGFDFNYLPKCGDGKHKRIDFHHLLKHLWPGDPKEHVARINKHIRIHNLTQQNRTRTRNIPLVCQQEFFKFFGVLLLARIEGVPGGNLWKNEGKSEGWKTWSNVEKDIMHEHRFRQLKRFIPFMWSDDSKKKKDPWWQIILMQEEFNQSRKQKVLSHFLKIADETMSAFRPQTTKTGNLPHLSYIQRKPEDLGTEMKSMACAVMKIMLYLEIQRSKKDRLGRCFEDLVKRVTTACCMRMVNETWQREVTTTTQEDDVEEEVFVGDSWFGSVRTAVSLKKRMPDGKESGCILNIKTGHSRYPKAFLEGTMSTWPGGSHLVMEATVDDVKLYAVGYKYCKKKTMCFIFTEGASHTEQGEPYRAKWTDENNNNMQRDVPRPECCSQYWAVSNVVDVLNQQRQKELRLEKFWITEDGYFRIMTSVFGICVVDCWNAYKHHIPHNHRHKDCELMTVANMMAKDLLENQENDSVEIEQQSLTIGVDGTGTTNREGVPSTVLRSSPGGNTTISNLTMEELSTRTDNAEIQQLRVELEVRKHQCTDGEVQHNTKRVRNNKRTNSKSERNGKRSGRFSCMECKSRGIEYRCNTHCTMCPAPKRAKAYWLCKECEVVHQNRIRESNSV